MIKQIYGGDESRTGTLRNGATKITPPPPVTGTCRIRWVEFEDARARVINCELLNEVGRIARLDKGRSRFVFFLKVLC